MNRMLRGTGSIIAAVLLFALVGTTSAQAAPAAAAAAPAASSGHIDWEIPDFEIPAKDKAIIEKFCKDPIGTITWLKKEFLSAAEAAFLTKLLPHFKELAAKAEVFFKQLLELIKKKHGHESVTSLKGKDLKKPIDLDILLKLCGSHGGGSGS